jgi:hypothetical protein
MASVRPSACRSMAAMRRLRDDRAQWNDRRRTLGHASSGCLPASVQRYFRRTRGGLSTEARPFGVAVVGGGNAWPRIATSRRLRFALAVNIGIPSTQSPSIRLEAACAQRFSREVFAFPSPDSDNHPEAASPKRHLRPSVCRYVRNCPETASLGALLAEQCRSDIGNLDQGRNENWFIRTLLRADTLADQGDVARHSPARRLTHHGIVDQV